MGSSLSSLYIGVSGLNVSQNALNTTAHNLANIDTKGYVRQQILFKDTNYSSKSAGYLSPNQVGLGADIDLVRQVRDRFLDKSYRLETGRQGFYDAQAKAVRELEDVFGELDGVAFQDSIESLWQTMQELINEPSSIVKRSLFINTAGSFVERANIIAKQLEEYQISLNTEITVQVNKINNIGNEIVSLNRLILQKESAGVERANDLRDTRNQLLDELGLLANITYREDTKGVVTVNLEGVPFVGEESMSKMDLAPVNSTSKMLKPVWTSLNQDVFQLNRAYSSENNTDVGSLRGLLIARGDFKANYTSIPVEPKQADYADVNAYNAAYNKFQTELEYYNNMIEPSTVMTVQAQLDRLVHGVVTRINDILCPNIEKTYYDSLGQPVTMTVLDTELAPIGLGEDNQKQGNELFSRKSQDRYIERQVFDDLGNPVKVYEYQPEVKGDYFSLYTVSELEINSDLINNVSLLPLSNAKNPDAFDKTVRDALSEMWNSKFAPLGPNTMTTNTLKGFYTAMISELANRGDTFETIANSQNETSTAIDHERQKVSGVSSDEELTNLIKFQHSYNAAARYVNVVNEMLEHIINTMFS